MQTQIFVVFFLRNNAAPDKTMSVKSHFYCILKLVNIFPYYLLYFAQHDGSVRGSRSVIHKIPPKLEDSATVAAWTRGTSSRWSAQQMSNLQFIYLGQRRLGCFCVRRNATLMRRDGQK